MDFARYQQWLGLVTYALATDNLDMLNRAITAAFIHAALTMQQVSPLSTPRMPL